MTEDKSMHYKRYDTSSRLHIIVLYLLLASVTIACAIYFVHFTRSVQSHMDSTYAELNLLKERLSALESTQITVTATTNGYDALRRQSRYARIKAKSVNKQSAGKKAESLPADLPSDMLTGSIHFKVPVRERSSRLRINQKRSIRCCLDLFQPIAMSTFCVKSVDHCKRIVSENEGQTREREEDRATSVI